MFSFEFLNKLHPQEPDPLDTSPLKGKYKSALRGKYFLSHPEKNVRGAAYILFKSKLEAMFIKFLDTSPDVLRWDYENPMNTIPYFDPIQNRQRHYIVDFVMWVKSGPTI